MRAPPRPWRGEASQSSVTYALSLVTEAAKLVLWLCDQQLQLADLRQDLVDEWIAGGARKRRRVRLFLAWLQCERDRRAERRLGRPAPDPTGHR